MKPLTNQEKRFVKEVIETGNQTQAVIKAFPKIKDTNYAHVKGNRLIRKDTIKKAVKTIADSLPDKLLVKTHLEGLNATEGILDKPDYSVRHKYLDSAYKIKNYYPKEATTAVQVNINRFESFE